MRLATFVMAALLLGATVGCGKSEDSASTNAATPASTSPSPGANEGHKPNGAKAPGIKESDG